MNTKTKQFLFGGIVLMVLAIVVVFSIKSLVYNQDHRTAANEDAELSTTASALYDAFRTDETTANAKYVNKMTEVTGRVKSVTQQDGFLELELGQDKLLVLVTIPMNQVPQTPPQAGSQLTVRGIVNGYDPLGDYVMLDQAVVVDE